MGSRQATLAKKTSLVGHVISHAIAIVAFVSVYLVIPDLLARRYPRRRCPEIRG